MAIPGVALDCAQGGPLFNDNRMKLGLFGINVNSAGAITQAPDRHEISWDQNLRLVQQAEAAGFEAAVPIARWRGFGGITNPWGRSFETFTWAAALAAATSRISIISTINMLTFSPVSAAKQLSTIDHISHGRAVLNVVAGWMEKEAKMFGVGKLGHDERYSYGAEWMEVLHKLLVEDDEFDFHGSYLNVEGGYQQPKALQSPRPPIMNAAFSPAGHEFAAQWADVAFVSPDARRPGSAAEQVTNLRRLAAERGRSIQVWVATSIAAAETESAARAYVERYSEDQVDGPAVENMVNAMMGGTGMSPEQKANMTRQAAAHVGGFPLVGSYQQVADEIASLSEAGVEGICLTWMDYERGLDIFIREVLPLMEKQGLRRRMDVAA
ncbi:LLM class flavin-dependent oxidoreductase [Sphingobium sp. SCG-1]|uniref:LLM class flavin-dependent oxidoreductase n=1 Tax=Sphingobium sp. SCG-1 TaxID=2072936 RepID=UPI001CB9CFF8|nr:LLM class flavin-dependent oxidoreductase [Sphingobium sp. SCG-1]